MALETPSRDVNAMPVRVPFGRWPVTSTSMPMSVMRQGTKRVSRDDWHLSWVVVMRLATMVTVPTLGAPVRGVEPINRL